VGICSAAIGGAARAALIHDYLSELLGGFGFPMEIVVWALVVFVAVLVMGGAVAGAVITWLSFRLARSRSPRPLS
jgi:hypothetical protein